MHSIEVELDPGSTIFSFDRSRFGTLSVRSLSALLFLLCLVSLTHLATTHIFQDILLQQKKT
jgi:hypothetical protein